MANYEDVLAIRGGGIDLEAPLKSAWVVKPCVVDGRTFIPIHTKEYRCQQFFENDFAMVQHITELRNAHVMAAMQSLVADDDPNESQPMQPGMPKRPTEGID